MGQQNVNIIKICKQQRKSGVSYGTRDLGASSAAANS